MKYKEELKKFIGESVKYDEWGGGYIWGLVKNDGLQMLADVVNVNKPAFVSKDTEIPIVSIRGCGAIQHLFKTRKEQNDFQDELGLFIQDAINEKLKSL